MNIQIKELSVTVKTVPLTARLFKQMDETREFNDVRQAIKDEKVLGWVHGSVTGDDHAYWLIFIHNGEYKRFKAAKQTAEKFQQIYL